MEKNERLNEYFFLRKDSMNIQKEERVEDSGPVWIELM